MRILVFLFCLTISYSVFAETIDGPANLRVSANGTLAVSLNDGVQVYVDKKEGDWYKILFVAYVSKDDYRLTKTIQAGVDLFDYRGKLIGKTMNAFSDFDHFEDGGKVGLFIRLYTYKNNIIKASILENEVVGLINSNTLNRKSIVDLKYLQIQKWASVEGYQGGIVMEPLTGGPFPPGIRFIFFVQDQKVVAIAGNDKLNNFDFDCVGKTKVEEMRLNIFYFDGQVYAKRELFEESLYAAFGSMH